MKFNDISTNVSSAEAARTSLRKQNVQIDENIGGVQLRDVLDTVRREVDQLSSKGGAEYVAAVLQKEVYESLLDQESVVTEGELDDTDLEQAEVVIAAQSMSSEFQDMIEDVADMLGSDLITLVDQIKAKIGDAEGQAFGDAIKNSLTTALDTLTSTKDAVDSAIAGLTDPMSAAAPADDMDISMDMPADGGDDAPVMPSSSGPEEEPTGRELKGDIE
jgi:exonuclease V gamma subunit